MTRDDPDVVVLLDRERLEAALPDVAAVAVAGRMAADVGGHGPVHPPARVAVLAGPDDEVEMVGYEALAEQPHRDAQANLGEQAEECGVVPLVTEDLNPGVAPVEDVVAGAAGRGPDGSRHRIISSEQRRGMTTGHSATLSMNRSSRSQI